MKKAFLPIVIIGVVVLVVVVIVGVFNSGPSQPGVYVNKDWDNPLKPASGDEFGQGPFNYIPSHCSICIYPVPTEAQGAGMVNLDMNTLESRSSGDDLLAVESENIWIALYGGKKVLVAQESIGISDGEHTMTLLVVNGVPYYLVEDRVKPK